MSWATRACDVVGYSRLVAEDEAGTLERLKGTPLPEFRT